MLCARLSRGSRGEVVATLKISLGQCSDAGAKPVNQDFYGALLPGELQLNSKGFAAAVADGISSSAVSHIASCAAVTTFLDDYFCTSDAWSVRKSGQAVLLAINSWLHSQTHHSPYRFDKDRGYVCTFSGLIIKGRHAHLFHVGDTRIYRLCDGSLEQLTQDHRLRLSEHENYLGRALGVTAKVEIDYLQVPVDVGDIFLLATDGVYEYFSSAAAVAAIAAHGNDLDAAAAALVAAARAAGSPDNLTLQLVRVDELPLGEVTDLQQRSLELPFAPELTPRMVFDGFTIVRPLHQSSRSHIYLAQDQDRTPVVLKLPSVDLRAQPAYLERLLLEEWVARRIDHARVLKAYPPRRRRHYLYTTFEFVEGQTLAQWRLDHGAPSLEAVRAIVEQVALGLRALHRLEMLHQDVRPENIMVDATGTVTIIDLGAVRVAGIAELTDPEGKEAILGTTQFAAPEYFLGEQGTARSDQFSLAVLTYYLLTGQLPFGVQVSQVRTRAQLHRLKYQSAQVLRPDIPAWVDGALRQATHPNPAKRYEDVVEFTYDLRNPNPAFVTHIKPPLLERDPVRFWQAVALISLACLVAVLAIGQ